MLRVSPDGKYVWVQEAVSNMNEILDSQTLQVVNAQPVGKVPTTNAWTPDGRQSWVVLRQNSVRREVVDLPALIRRRSWFDDHPPAPAASPPALSLRPPPPARPRKPRLAPAARRLQANGAPAEAPHD